MHTLYSLLWTVALPFVFLRLLWRSRKLPAYRRRWAERLGYGTQNAPCIWLHAVSVGEFNAAIPLIRALISNYPKHRILITTTTPTGSQRVTETFGEQVSHRYLPFDLPSCTRRFLQNEQPQLALIMETELWPNILHACKRQDIPVVLVNARLSDSSFTSYQKAPQTLLRNTLNCITVVGTQSPLNTERFEALHAPNVQTFGNIKFDLNVTINHNNPIQALLDPQRPCWIAASTHTNEETQVLQAHEQILQSVPDCVLILVPRHPDRFDEVAALLAAKPQPHVLRSDERQLTSQENILLGNSLGEMMDYYAAADIAFVGGSLVSVGGHNMLEPAALAKPIISGIHYHNFTEITEGLEHVNGIRIVENAEALAATVIELLQDPSSAQEMGGNAEQFFQAHSGAVNKIIATCKTLLEP